MQFHKELKVEGCRGEKIHYSGIEFSGSPREVFWTFMRPCLEDVVAAALAEAEEAGKKYTPEVAREGMDESAALLKALVVKVYTRMADIDRRLRGKGDPRSVKPYDPTGKITEMEQHIEERARVIKDHIEVPTRVQAAVGTLEKHPVTVGLVIAIVSAVLGAVAGAAVTYWLTQAP